MDDSTEEQRAEAYRVESMRHLERQAKAAQGTRDLLLVIVIAALVGGVIWLFIASS